MSHRRDGTDAKKTRVAASPNQKGEHGGGIPVPVQTPDARDLPFRMDGNVKEFHLIAEPVKQEIIPGRVVDLWAVWDQVTFARQLGVGPVSGQHRDLTPLIRLRKT